MSDITRIKSVTALEKVPPNEPNTQPVSIILDDGTEYFTDANLPPDQWLRAELVVWLAAGGKIEAARKM